MTTETNNETIEAPADEIVSTESPAAPPSLTIKDLGNLRNIIDVASKRGAFRTEEFSMVGETYTKLATFITAITPPAEEAPAEEAPAEEAPAEAPAEAPGPATAPAAE